MSRAAAAAASAARTVTAMATRTPARRLYGHAQCTRDWQRATVTAGSIHGISLALRRGMSSTSTSRHADAARLPLPKDVRQLPHHRDEDPTLDPTLDAGVAAALGADGAVVLRSTCTDPYTNLAFEEWSVHVHCLPATALPAVLPPCLPACYPSLLHTLDGSAACRVACGCCAVCPWLGACCFDRLPARCRFPRVH